MKSYLDIVENVLNNGKWKSPVRKNEQTGEWEPVDGGVRTLACPNVLFSHDMKEGFPLLTTKKMAFKTMCVELEGFIKGITDKEWFQERKCKIWNEWANPEVVSRRLDNVVDDYPHIRDAREYPTKKELQRKEKDLGPIYGYLWRCFPPEEHVVEIQPKTTSYDIHEGPVDTREICNSVELVKRDLSKLDTVLYKNWYDMIRRCYDERCSRYGYYGAKGVRVCKRWLSFPNYRKDIESLNGWQNKMRDPKGVTLDKDYYRSKVYAPDTCVYLSYRDNKLYNSCTPIEIYKDGESYKFLNFTRAAAHIGVTRRAVAMACENERACKGWVIEKLRGVWRYKLPVDQLRNIVDNLKNNPMDRRMVCSAWNPSVIDRAALPSCHYSWNVTVIGNELNLFWSQRSCDLMLGVPFNIASYGLLLSLLAEVGGFERGNLSGMLVDCHIYENQIEAAREQIKRKPGELPELYITEGADDFDIFQWTHEDVLLKNYNPQEKISFGDVVV